MVLRLGGIRRRKDPIEFPAEDRGVHDLEFPSPFADRGERGMSIADRLGEIPIRREPAVVVAVLLMMPMPVGCGSGTCVAPPPPMNRRATSDAARAFRLASSASVAAVTAEVLASAAAEWMNLRMPAACVRDDGDDVDASGDAAMTGTSK
jgi:hypothetical protein